MRKLLSATSILYLLLTACAAKNAALKACNVEQIEGVPMPKSWLKGPISIEEVRSSYQGWKRETDFEKLSEALKPGDEIYWYEPPDRVPPAYRNFQAGFGIVRKCRWFRSFDLFCIERGVSAESLREKKGT